MTDIVLETLRALVLLGIVLFLCRVGRERFWATRKGWNLIIAGFGLLLFGSLIDITDNFEALNRFVVVGDTEVQAFLEKFVGFLGGFLVLAWGLVLWMPRTQRLASEIGKREARLHETGKILTATIENFPGGISVFDADLKLVAFNRAFSEVLEFPPHLIRDGMRYEDVIRYNAERGEYGEGDIDQLVQARVDLARRFEPHCFERIRPTGEVIEIRGAPMPEGGFITTYIDITERKRAAAEIEKRDALLHGIVTTVGDAIITTDERAVITSFNPGAERIFGHRAAEAIGRNIKLLMPAEYAREHNGHVARYRGSGASSVIGARRDLLGLRKDGATFPMDLVLDEMTIGGRRMFTGIIRDVTEQRQREEALRSKTAKLALMESVASNANRITSIDAFIQSCLDDICEYSGWPVGHAYRTASDGAGVLRSSKIWHLDDPARFEIFRRRTGQTSFKPGVGMIGQVMASGEPAWVSDITKHAGFSRTAKGEDVGIKGAFAVPAMVRNKCALVLEFFSPDAVEPDHELLAVIANVAEQIGRRMEREQADQALRTAKAQAERARRHALSAAEEARAASQAKSDFLANMSHELRTPLNGILGLTTLIEQETLGPLGHEQYAGYIKIIGSSGRHLVTVINDVLDYSKIEAGMLELDPVAFELSQVTDTAVELLASTAREKAIDLTCSVAPEVPQNLIGDPVRLRQILLNLTGNAIKFTDQGGVRVEVSREAASGDQIVLRFDISDTGIGIDEHARETLFDKFTQADPSTTRKHGGTGLGLAISKQLVELMDGEIGVDSEPGQGSTFWFTVKLARQVAGATGEHGRAEAARH